MPENEPKHTILIVDDLPENIDVLGNLLRSDYKLKVATNGPTALRIAADKPHPDLILLDVNMPDMDGYEVCEKLMADSTTKEIPIVFVTTMGETDQEFKGLSLGAVDYIAKPFQPVILLSRIKTHLFVAESKQQLKEYSLHLEEMVKARTQELAEAHESLKVLDHAKRDFLMVLSHELRTPATGLLGFGDLMASSLKNDAEKKSVIEAYQRSKSRLMQMIDDVQILTQLKTGDDFIGTTHVELKSLLKLVKNGLRDYCSDRDREINLSIDSDVNVRANEELLHRSLETLLKAAVLLTAKTVTVEVEKDAEQSAYFIQFQFRASGQDHSDLKLDDFFDMYSSERPSSRVQELGFGLPVASTLIQAMGGQVSVSHPESTILLFQVTLSLAM